MRRPFAAKRRRQRYFNTRTTYVVRRIIKPFAKFDILFQYTHHIRGATHQHSQPHQDYNISIHAPHTWCDLEVGARLLINWNFNTRTTYVVRQSPASLSSLTSYFNTRTTYVVRLQVLLLCHKVLDFNTRTTYVVRLLTFKS